MMPGLPEGNISELLPPAEFVEVARAALSQAGVNPAEIDPAAPHAGLRRYCGIAFASIGRWLRERPVPKPLRLYLVNSDGERVEYQEAKLELSPQAAGRLATALSSATDFVQTGDKHWCWISRQHTRHFAHGENMADLDGIGPRFSASASSPQRFARLLDRLAELCNERPTILTMTVQRPWEDREGVVPAPGEGIRTVALTTGAPLFDMDEETARRNSPRLLLESVRYQLGQEIEALGGIPKDLVHTTEGRCAVEQWLAMAEARGLPVADKDQPVFFDWDPLRVELGLRPVADQIARGLGSPRPPAARRAEHPRAPGGRLHLDYRT